MVKKCLFTLCIAFVVIVSLLALSGCSSGNSTPPVGTTGSPSASQSASPTPEAADDLIFTPAGVIIYRVNLNAPNKWPVIPTVTKTFVVDTDTISVTYRDYIETKAGQTRNDIISIIDTERQIRYNQIGPNPIGSASISFTVVGLPAGITADTEGPIKFKISSDVKSAQYTFQINVQINGASYTLPCTIKVS